MTLRREPTYLSTEVWRAIYLLSKSRNAPDTEPGRTATPDSVADDLLRDLIKEKYPQLLEHQKQVAQLEKELIESIT